MRLLLDTHVLIWSMIDSPKLTQEARALLTDCDNELFFSAASLWEIALKHERKPKDIPIMAEQAERFCRENGVEELPVRFRHALRVNDLPSIHADPFDRLIIAQALDESLALLTHDDNILQYGGFAIRA